MYANQTKLPRLPLPSLEDSLARYLRAVAPLVSEAEFELTRAIVAAQLAAGSKLRKIAESVVSDDKSGRQTSYVSEAWQDMYLEGRWPLAINSNPCSATRTAAFGPDATTQVTRAARVVAATVAFAHEVEAGSLRPDEMKGMPLDMRQYPRMFGATRLPRTGRDELHKAPAGRSGHIVVLRGDHFWEVPVVDEKSGRPLSVAALERALQQVVDQSAPSAKASLAVLTTAERDAWAGWRADLEAHSPVNRTSLAAIDDALFHMCLDEASVGVEGGAEPKGAAQVEAAVHLALCGEPQTAPRWFDKSITLMMSADGVPMLSFEHSWGDGIAVVRCGAETYARVAKGRYAPAAPDEAAAHPPRRLQFEVPASCAAARDTCATEYRAIAKGLDLAQLRFDKWGAQQVKEWGMSPDACAQAAMALAFYKSAGRMGATYESAAMAHFHGGRTETIRPATSEAAAFCKAVADGAPLDEQARLLRAMGKRHSVVCREAAEGKGFDRHLFVLKKLAEEEARKHASAEVGAAVGAVAGGAAGAAVGAAVGATLARTLSGSGDGAATALDDPMRLFTDPSFLHLAGNELSTSNPPPLQNSLQSGFGPVHPQGLGVLYTTFNDRLQFCTSAHAPAGRSAKAYRAELEAALLHIGKLLEMSAPAAKR